MSAASQRQTLRSRSSYLFEGLQHLGSLTEVFEDELQRARHQRGVILHDEVDQNPQEGPATLVIQLHRTQLGARNHTPVRSVGHRPNI